MGELPAPGVHTAPARRGRQTEQYWRSQVKAWRASGLKQNEFCRRGEVSWYGFRYWKVKLDAEEGGVAKGGKLVAIRVASVDSGGGEIRIRVGGRYIVEVPPGFDGSTLREVIELLERR
jgi:hypothetical protein